MAGLFATLDAMKQIKYIATFLLIILGVFVLAFIFMQYGERPKSEFSNYSEAKASGIMDKGWIPTFIPKSAVNIQEQHDIDTNWVKMSFKYNVGDIENTRGACKSETPFNGGIEFNCEYFSNNVSIKLFSNGKAELYSSPKKASNKRN